MFHLMPKWYGWYAKCIITPKSQSCGRSASCALSEFNYTESSQIKSFPFAALPQWSDLRFAYSAPAAAQSRHPRNYLTPNLICAIRAVHSFTTCRRYEYVISHRHIGMFTSVSIRNINGHNSSSKHIDKNPYQIIQITYHKWHQRDV